MEQKMGKLYKKNNNNPWGSPFNLPWILLFLGKNPFSYFTKKQYTQRDFSVGCILGEI